MKRHKLSIYPVQLKLILPLFFIMGYLMLSAAEEPTPFIPDIHEGQFILSDSIRLLIDPSDDLVVTCVSSNGQKEWLCGLEQSSSFDSVRFIKENGFAVGKTGNKLYLLHPDGTAFGPFSRIMDVQGHPFDRTWAAVVKSGRQIFVISAGYKSRAYTEIGTLVCHEVYGLVFTASRGDKWFMHINYEYFGPYQFKPDLYSDLQQKRGLAYTVPVENNWYLVPDYGIVHGPYTAIGVVSYSVDGTALAAAVTLQSGEDVVIVNGVEYKLSYVPDVIAVSGGGGRMLTVKSEENGFILYEKEKIIAGPFTEFGELCIDKQSSRCIYSFKRADEWYLEVEDIGELGPFDVISRPLFDLSMNKWMITARYMNQTVIIVDFEDVLTSDKLIGQPVLSNTGKWLAWAEEQDGKPIVKFHALE